MKIAIIGARSAAKEALAHRMAANAQMNGRGCLVLDDVSQKFHLAYDNINVDSCYYIICQQIVDELEKKSYEYSDLICLSSAIDPILYLNLRKVKQPYDELRRLAEKWMHTYDVILYVKSSENENAVADEFHMFQEQVDKAFDYYLQNYFKESLKTNIFKIESDDIFHHPTTILLNAVAAEEDWIKNFV